MFFWEILENTKMYREENEVTHDSTIQWEQMLAFWSFFF